MVQHARGPTHRCGNTLDLVVTFADRCPSDVTVDPPNVISDHALVVCHMPLGVDEPPSVERLVRGWRRVNRNKVRRALENSQLCRPVSVNQLFATYDTVLREMAALLAPARSIRGRPGRPTPWFENECRECRRLERQYRRTGFPGD